MQKHQDAVAEQKNSKQDACPNCGYCPHCGRGGYYMIPWPYRPLYPQPYIPYTAPYRQPTWTWGVIDSTTTATYGSHN